MKKQKTFQSLIERSYSAIKKRGLIDENTTRQQFYRKMKEELVEVVISDRSNEDQRYIEEVTDLATVCILQVKHSGYNFEDEFLKCIKKNERRAIDGK